MQSNNFLTGAFFGGQNATGTGANGLTTNGSGAFGGQNAAGTGTNGLATNSNGAANLQTTTPSNSTTTAGQNSYNQNGLVGVNSASQTNAQTGQTQAPGQNNYNQNGLVGATSGSQTNAQTGQTPTAGQNNNVQNGLVGVNSAPQTNAQTGQTQTAGQNNYNQNGLVGATSTQIASQGSQNGATTTTVNQNAQNTGATGQIGNATTVPTNQFNPTPWFLNPGIVSQFNLSSAQTAALNKAYGDALTAYNNGLGRINTNQNASQQQQAVGNLRKNFFQTLTNAVSQANLTPQQQVQYNQLYLQRQGYTAFNDASLQQKLMLSSGQVQQLDQQGQAWSQQLKNLQAGYQADPVGTTIRYNDLVRQYRQQFNSTLTSQQQQELQQLTGGSFAFPPGLIYQQVGAQ